MTLLRLLSRIAAQCNPLLSSASASACNSTVADINQKSIGYFKISQNSCPKPIDPLVRMWYNPSMSRVQLVTRVRTSSMPASVAESQCSTTGGVMQEGFLASGQRIRWSTHHDSYENALARVVRLAEIVMEVRLGKCGVSSGDNVHLEAEA